MTRLRSQYCLYEGEFGALKLDPQVKTPKTCLKSKSLVLEGIWTPTYVPANCCDETEEKWLRYCCTSRLEPMLLSNWMTVERVEREEPVGDAKPRRHESGSWVEAAERTARGRCRLDRRGHFASRQPLTAAWAAEERRVSMVTVCAQHAAMLVFFTSLEQSWNAGFAGHVELCVSPVGKDGSVGAHTLLEQVR